MQQASLGSANLQNIAESVQWQIKYLLGTLSTKKNLKLCTEEIHKLLASCGNKFEHLLIQLPLELVDVRDSKVQSGSKDQAKVSFLMQELSRLSQQPSYLRYVPQSFENLDLASIGDYVNDLFKTVKLQVHEQIVLLVALSHTLNPTYRADSIKLLKNRLKEYYATGKSQPLPSYAAHKLLLLLQTSPDFGDDPLFQREIAQFIRNSIGKTAPPPFELDLFFASKFAPSLSLSEETGTKTVAMAPALATQLQHGHVVDLVDLLIDCEPIISHNITALQSLVTEYRDQEFGESKMAELLIKLANSTSHGEEKTGVPCSSLYFQITKSGVKHNGQPVAIALQSSEPKMWHLDNLARVFRELLGKGSWDKVVEQMDKPNLAIIDSKAFMFLLGLYCKCRQGAFPLRLLHEKLWNNPEIQVTLLGYSFGVANKELINFEDSPRKQSKLESIQGIKSSALPFLPAWSNIDVQERFIELSESPHYMFVRSQFEYPIKNCAEYLLLTIAQTRPRGGQFLLDELYGILLPMFLANHVNSIVVLERLWDINQVLMMKSICNLYKYDPSLMNLSRVVDIAQEVKELLKNVLMMDCYEFTIPLAILAGKRDYLHLDQWLAERYRDIKEPFIESLMNYLESTVLGSLRESSLGETAEKKLDRCSLTQEMLAMVLESLRRQKGMLPALDVRISNFHKEIVSLIPSLVAPTHESTGVEELANRWFHRVFSSEVSVGDLIEKMRQYKNSKNPVETEIYACMIHNLLDEYRFFNRYPEKELKIMGQLFGSVIQNKLVDNILERISLKYVFEALKRNGKLLRFGIYALEQFIERLKEWPASVEVIVKMTNVKNHYPDLYSKVYAIYQNLRTAPSSSTATISAPPNTQQGVTDAAPAAPIESPLLSPVPTLLMAPPVAPPSTLPPPVIHRPTAPHIPAGTHPMTVNSPPPSTYPPAQYPGGYMYPSQQAPLHYNWPPAMQQPGMQPPGSGVPMGAYPRPQMMPPAKRPIFPGPTTGVPSMPPANYQDMIKKVDKEHSDYFGHPQNPPASSASSLIAAAKESKASDSSSCLSVTNYPEEDKKPSKELLHDLNLKLNMVTESETDRVKKIINSAIVSDRNALPWLAITIAKRAANEPNHHRIYQKLIDGPESKSLHSAVLVNLYKIVKWVLESNKSEESPPDILKKNMKNMGIFLGMLTLGSGKPVLAKDLDLKEILIESYSKEAVTLPLALTCQLLRQAVGSTVFRLNNPWMKAIFGVIIDLFDTPLVNQNFGNRSEITILCESFSKCPADFKPGNALRPKPQMATIHRPSPVYYRPPVPPFAQAAVSAPAFFPASSIQPFIAPQIRSAIINPESIKNAIDMSIQEILKPVIERSVTIALITTREIVLKDFAFEPNEKKLMEAANNMVQCLAGSLAMVTCREPLRMSMTTKIKEIFLAKYAPDFVVKNFDQVIKTLCNDNLEVGSSYIQKSVIIRARQRVGEDQAIKEAVERRKMASSSRTSFIAPHYLLPWQIPELLKPKKEGVTPLEFSVYSEFMKVLQENTMTNPMEEHADGEGKGVARSEALIMMNAMIEDGTYATPEVYKGRFKKFQDEVIGLEKTNHSLLDQIIKEVLQLSARATRMASEKQAKEAISIYTEMLAVIKQVYKPLSVRVSEHLFRSVEDDRKYCYDWISILFKFGLIDIASYDQELSAALKKIQSYPHATSSALLTFVACLVTNLMLSEKVLLPSNFSMTFHEMNLIKKFPIAQENAAFSAMLIDLESNRQFDPKDRAFRGTSIQLLEEWLAICQENSTDQLPAYVGKLTAHFVNSDERFISFFTTIMDAAVGHALFTSALSSSGAPIIVPAFPDRLDYRIIDNVLKLLFMIMRSKIGPNHKHFNNFLRMLAMQVCTHHEDRLVHFNQRPYYRAFALILQSLTKKDMLTVPVPEYVSYIASALHEVAPRKCPAFAFAWLSLVTDCSFLPQLLAKPNDEKYMAREGKMVMLICDMYTFLKMVLAPGVPPTPSATLYYEAAFKTTLVILHDFPSLLSTYYFDLLAQIPYEYIQLRNIILCAVPENIKALEVKNGMKVDQMEEAKILPKFVAEYKEILKYRNIKEDVDSYLHSQKPSLLVDICNKLMSPDPAQRTKRAEPHVFHALVLYLYEFSVALQDQGKEQLDITNVLNSLFSKLDVASRESLLNSLFDEVRYPNSYTMYSVSYLLHLMEPIYLQFLQEQVYRISMERKMVNFAVPWGLRIMLDELHQNSIYDLTNRPFYKRYSELLFPLKAQRSPSL